MPNLAMTSPRNYFPMFPYRFRVAVLIILILSITVLPPNSVGTVVQNSSYGTESKQKKPVLGSRPPECMNKCLSCRPCEATLVVPPHIKRMRNSSQDHEDDTYYYLVSWKCKCGNKLYQP